MRKNTMAGINETELLRVLQDTRKEEIAQFSCISVGGSNERSKIAYLSCVRVLIFKYTTQQQEGENTQRFDNRRHENSLI
jgi:hypothetical protein